MQHKSQTRDHPNRFQMVDGAAFFCLRKNRCESQVLPCSLYMMGTFLKLHHYPREEGRVKSVRWILVSLTNGKLMAGTEVGMPE
jgi:hypothetical protein